MFRTLIITVLTAAAVSGFSAQANTEITAKAFVLTDTRCGQACDTSRIVSDLKRDFPGIQLTMLDYNSTEGRAVMKESGLKRLPAVLFDQSVIMTRQYIDFRRLLRQAGPYYSLTVAAPFDPFSENCTNTMDDDSNGQADCKDPACARYPGCRPSSPQNLKLFTMADDRYGKKAIAIMASVKQNAGTNFKPEVHYLVQQDYPGHYSTMGGQFEANEVMTRLCVRQHYPASWFDYTSCRAESGLYADPSSCAAQFKIDTRLITSCVQHDGQKLLAQGYGLAQEMRVEGSPTWVINDQEMITTLSATDVMARYTALNPGTAANPAAVQETPPDFSLKDLNQKAYTLRAMKGKKVVLLFWGSHCSACREEMPLFQKLHEQNKDVTVLAINIGERIEFVANFMMGMKYTFTALLDRDQSVANTYLISATPSVLFINTDGTLAARHTGVLNDEKLQEFIKGMK